MTGSWAGDWTDLSGAVRATPARLAGAEITHCFHSGLEALVLPETSSVRLTQRYRKSQRS